MNEISNANIEGTENWLGLASTETLFGWALGKYRSLRIELERQRDLEHTKMATATTMQPRQRMSAANTDALAASYMYNQVNIMHVKFNGDEQAFREWLQKVNADDFDWRAEYHAAGI